MNSRKYKTTYNQVNNSINYKLQATEQLLLLFMIISVFIISLVWAGGRERDRHFLFFIINHYLDFQKKLYR